MFVCVFLTLWNYFLKQHTIYNSSMKDNWKLFFKSLFQSWSSKFLKFVSILQPNCFITLNSSVDFTVFIFINSGFEYVCYTIKYSQTPQIHIFLSFVRNHDKICERLPTNFMHLQHSITKSRQAMTAGFTQPPGNTAVWLQLNKRQVNVWNYREE